MHFFLSTSLRGLGFDGAYERAFPNDIGSFATDINGVDLYYSLVSKDHLSDQPQATDPQAISLVASLLDSGKYQAEKDAAIFLENLQDSDPNKGVLQAALAKSKFLRQTSRYAKIPGQALPEPVMQEIDSLYSSVITGEIESTLPTYEQALWEYASFVHEVKQERISAYSLYRSIHDRAEDEGEKIRALVMIAAITMELADSELSYYNEVRRLCDQIFSDYPDDYGKAKSVARLMKAESYLFEGATSQAIDSLSELAWNTDIPMHERERVAALYMLGSTHERLGNTDEAIQCFIQGIQSNASANTSFFWAGENKNLVVSCTLSLKRLLEQNGEEYNNLSDLLADIESVLNSESGISLSKEEILFSTEIYQYTDHEISARNLLGGLNHACVCPQHITSQNLNECSHGDAPGVQPCAVNACIRSVGEISQCTHNTSKPDPPASGEPDCPNAVELVAHRSQWEYGIAGEGNIPGCYWERRRLESVS